MVEVECFGVSGRLAVIDGTVNSVLSYADNFLKHTRTSTSERLKKNIIKIFGVA